MKNLLLITILLSSAASADEADLIFYMQHAIDVAQTYQIAKSRCHSEAGLGTSSLIGENPSGESVIIWGVATVIGYHLIKDKLPKWTKHINISYRTYNVNSNYNNGLTVGSHSCDTSDVRFYGYY